MKLSSSYICLTTQVDKSALYMLSLLQGLKSGAFWNLPSGETKPIESIKIT